MSMGRITRKSAWWTVARCAAMGARVAMIAARTTHPARASLSPTCKSAKLLPLAALRSELFSSKMLGGASQTVSKIRVNITVNKITRTELFAPSCIA